MSAPTTKLMPVIKQQFFTTNGLLPLSSGLVHTYVAGTSTPQTTYTDSTGLTANTNPVVLDSSGRADIWLDTTLNYKFVVSDSNNVTQYTEDNINNGTVAGVTSIIAGTGISVSGATGNVTVTNTYSINEWLPLNLTPSYVNTTTFTVIGNQTAILNTGRRVKITVSAGVVYGSVVSAVYTSLTTVIVTLDGTSVLDSGISAVSYGFISGTPTSAPAIFGLDIISVPSASTTPIGAAPTTTVFVTGTTTITAFDVATEGIMRFVNFASALTITHNATTMILPNNADFSVAAGSTLLFVSLGSGNWQYLMGGSQAQGTGIIIDFAGTSAPAGYLVCPTAQTNISRVTYAALFAVIGTTWGVGDGTTTFGMPWFAPGYAAVQANSNVGTATVGALLAHTHTISSCARTGNPVSGGATVFQGNGTYTTDSTGGAANYAAGVAVLKCVKY